MMTNEPEVVREMRHYEDAVVPTEVMPVRRAPRIVLDYIDALTAERDALAARLDALEPMARSVAADLLLWDTPRKILALLDTPRTPEAT